MHLVEATAMADKNDMLELGLSLLNTAFENTHFTKLRTKIVRVINISALITLLILSTISLWGAREQLILKNIESCVTEIHVSH